MTYKTTLQTGDLALLYVADILADAIAAFRDIAAKVWGAFLHVRCGTGGLRR